MQAFLSGIRMWFKTLNIINRLSIGEYLSVKTIFTRPRRPDCYFKYVLRSLFSADGGVKATALRGKCAHHLFLREMIFTAHSIRRRWSWFQRSWVAS